MESSFDRKQYRNFRKLLLQQGFQMMQKSVYTKLALNMTAAIAIMDNVRINKPKKGLIQMLTITEKQYSRIEIVIGDEPSGTISSTERLIVL